MRTVDNKEMISRDTRGYVTVDGVEYEPHEYILASLALMSSILMELRYMNREKRNKEQGISR